MSKLRQINNAAQRVLDSDPDPIVRFLIFRDVLRLSPGSSQLANARKGLQKNMWVQRLKTWQHPNGGWGRFHSRNSQCKDPIPTTEFAIDRALTLGLQRDDLILKKAARHITDILHERIPFPDPVEKNARWATGWRLIAAGKLAKVNPHAKALNRQWKLWAEIARRTFAAGQYDPNAEIRAHYELTGAPADLRYLKIDNKYAAALLGSRRELLPRQTEKAYVAWLYGKNKGIMYFCSRLCDLPGTIHAGGFDRWLCAHELLSKFPAWRRFTTKIIDWFWAKRGNDGLWDFGPRDPASFYLPLSATWRNRKNRANDWSTRILILLRKFESG